jgi:hypothetical protein
LASYYALAFRAPRQMQRMPLHWPGWPDKSPINGVSERLSQMNSYWIFSGHLMYSSLLRIKKANTSLFQVTFFTIQVLE